LRGKVHPRNRSKISGGRSLQKKKKTGGLERRQGLMARTTQGKKTDSEAGGSRKKKGAVRKAWKGKGQPSDMKRARK